jgi:hypothetical protein
VVRVAEVKMVRDNACFGSTLHMGRVHVGCMGHHGIVAMRSGVAESPDR